MKHLTAIATLTAATLLLAACQSDVYHIKGEARTFTPGTVLCLSADLYNGQPADTIVVSQEGTFSMDGTTDTTRLCMLYPAGQPGQNIMFFLEPGNIYIELSTEPSRSRVSGTKLNNEWQALNDTVAKYDQTLRKGNVAKDAPAVYNSLRKRILETARRNKDNALGKLIYERFEN